MNKFTRHVRARDRDLYLNENGECVAPIEEFQTLEELLVIPYIARIKDDGRFIGFKFTQFARAESRLIAMCNDNLQWHVVGYVEDDSVLEPLPYFHDVKKTK